jgi:hypothetical protein
MTTEMSLKAQEGSSYIIEAAFFLVKSDGTEVALTPNDGLVWSLFDSNGSVVNNRSDQPLTPAEVVYIPLSGADLALSGNYPASRYVTIEGTYDSLYGLGLRLVKEIHFQIENLVGA